MRLAILTGFTLVMFAVLLVRFSYFQVVMHAHYDTLAEANRIAIELSRMAISARVPLHRSRAR